MEDGHKVLRTMSNRFCNAQDYHDYHFAAKSTKYDNLSAKSVAE